ncbi:MAG: hypothetical protein GX620_08750 [Chloroflexi bacterium]|nr:hypothetical protein [Chloroflexota bacterium]
MLKVIVDFDGTLTAEETQVGELAAMSLTTLATEIIDAPRKQLASEYEATRARLMARPQRYCWVVNGLVASYCDEGAFILNTTTLQVMLRDNPYYLRRVSERFPVAEYDPVVDCTNYLFHRHTADLGIAFRPCAREVLVSLIERPDVHPVILTNSLGDKVRRHIDALGLPGDVAILGDTRQYEMAPEWTRHFDVPGVGEAQIWPISDVRTIDLRRPAYYRALVDARSDGASLAVVADTFSLPGALPLMMGIPFYLCRTPYTPDWCVEVVGDHPCGVVLNDLAELLGVLSLC